ncbi:MAG: hypothetical protein EAY75_14750 [Bacteroidetes bacterium]|nr:MAG: hypothetical protein EAY75_14750 [Bacteroidota bacterium]
MAGKKMWRINKKKHTCGCKHFESDTIQKGLQIMVRAQPASMFQPYTVAAIVIATATPLGK